MDGQEWPVEMHSYNERFTKMIEAVKRRHDPVVTTVGRFKKKKKSDDSSVGRSQLDKGESSPVSPSVFDFAGRESLFVKPVRLDRHYLTRGYYSSSFEPFALFK